MSRPSAQGADPAFARPRPLSSSSRSRSSVPLTSERRPALFGTHCCSPPRACISLDKQAALNAAKSVYKAAKAEYKARKAEYKALKEQLQVEQKQRVEQKPKPLLIADPARVDAVAVCDGKACCRMGADAVAMLLGSKTLRAPCMKMCGGVGPSVKMAGAVVKVDMKKAVKDAVQAGNSLENPPQRLSTSPSQSDCVLELLRSQVTNNSG
ncbi:unnamed protein product [Agarophyton chilense]